MGADWGKIRNDYINGGGSYAELAEKYNVSSSTVEKIGRKEGWKKAKKEQRKKIAEKTQEKTAEKIADTESEIAAIRARLRLTIMQQIETRMNLEETDGMEFRRLVQSFKDMCEITDGIGNHDESDDGFLDALNGSAEEDWSDESDIPI